MSCPEFSMCTVNSHDGNQACTYVLHVAYPKLNINEKVTSVCRQYFSCGNECQQLLALYLHFTQGTPQCVVRFKISHVCFCCLVGKKSPPVNCLCWHFYAYMSRQTLHLVSWFDLEDGNTISSFFFLSFFTPQFKITASKNMISQSRFYGSHYSVCNWYFCFY